MLSFNNHYWHFSFCYCLKVGLWFKWSRLAHDIAPTNLRMYGDVFDYCNHSWVLISFSLVLHTQPLTCNHWIRHNHWLPISLTCNPCTQPLFTFNPWSHQSSFTLNHWHANNENTQQMTCNHWLATIESDTTIDYPYHWQVTHALYHCLLATTGHINLCLHSTIAYTESVCLHSLRLTIGYTQPLRTLKKFTFSLHSTIGYTQPSFTQPLVTLNHCLCSIVVYIHSWHSTIVYNLPCILFTVYLLTVYILYCIFSYHSLDSPDIKFWVLLAAHQSIDWIFVYNLLWCDSVW